MQKVKLTLQAIVFILFAFNVNANEELAKDTLEDLGKHYVKGIAVNILNHYDINLDQYSNNKGIQYTVGALKAIKDKEIEFNYNNTNIKIKEDSIFVGFTRTF